MHAGEERDAAWAMLVDGAPLDASLGDHAPELGARGTFLVTIPADDGAPIAPRDANEASMVLRFVSASTHLESDQPIARLQTTWFAVFDPLPVPNRENGTPEQQTASTSGTAPARGVALLMPGMFGTPEGTLVALTKQLRRRGWCVVRMVAQPSDFTRVFEPALSPQHPGEAARTIAQVFDDRVAECAFAVQSALAEVERLEPSLAELPRVAIGFSAGAMTLPTVLAREPDRYAAAVLVGGGCHYWLLTQRSNYADWIGAVRPRWLSEPTDEQRRAIDDAYLDHARLDAFHTARAMRGVATLIIDGATDFAVPTPLADALWVRLGRPERWRDPVGHEMLFARLPAKFPRMLDWLDSKAGSREFSPANGEGGESAP
jgi:hypothetical protein